MIVSRKITATALLGVVMASAAALAKLRPASQMMATTTAAVPAAEVDSKRPKGLGDVIAENPTVKRYFGLDDD